MKVIKPQKLSLLTRPFERGGACHLCVTVLAGFAFGPPAALLPEVQVWKGVQAHLGKQAVLDLGMPKLRGELLVTGKGYPPAGAPAIACRVRVSLGPIDKTLALIGDRRWVRGVPSEPEPFSEMPITYERAFGGAGYSPNPVGKGLAPVAGEGGPVHPLPNVEDPRYLVRSPADRPTPAGLGPYGLTWPRRLARSGTYDARWLRERAPGPPDDFDWNVYNLAPEDQRIDGFFRGDEDFTLEGLHPDKPAIAAALPGLAGRAFLNRRSGEGELFEEVPLRLDTVHLIPGAELGILAFRGVARIAEDDAADVLQIVIACEEAGSPRPEAHYREVLRQRLDREKGPLLALRDEDLLPPGAASAPAWRPQREEPPLKRNLRARVERERERARERERELGLEPRPRHEPDVELPPADLENLDTLLEHARAQGEAQREEVARRRAESERTTRQLFSEVGLDYDVVRSEARRRSAGPPRFAAREELDKLAGLLREAGSALPPELEARLADPALRERLELAERQQLDAYRRLAHHYPAAERLGPEEAARVRAEVAAAHRSGEGLAGRDLTGADLSKMDLKGANLEGALLEGADLSGAELEGADLRGAVLARADLSGADLGSARLEGANLGAAKLMGARLHGADLTKATLARADLGGASLRGARLSRADFSETVFGDADLSGVKAEGVIFLRATLTGVKLAGAELTRCCFLQGSVEKVDFRGVTLTSTAFVETKGDGARFTGARLENLRLVKSCSFEGADFQDAFLARANLRGTRLAGADFSRARLQDADLSECSLRGANLYQAVASGARWIRADLSGASLLAANLMNGLFHKACLEGADFTGTNLFRADFTKARGKASSVRDAYLAQIRITERGADE